MLKTLLTFGGLISTIGILIGLFILIRMCILARSRKLNFINGLIMVELAIEVFVGIFMVYTFFDVGLTNFYEDVPGIVRSKKCSYYINFWLLFWIQSSIMHAAIIFCRYIYVR